MRHLQVIHVQAAVYHAGVQLIFDGFDVEEPVSQRRHGFVIRALLSRGVRIRDASFQLVQNVEHELRPRHECLFGNEPLASQEPFRQTRRVRGSVAAHGGLNVLRRDHLGKILKEFLKEHAQERSAIATVVLLGYLHPLVRQRGLVEPKKRGLALYTRRVRVRLQPQPLHGEVLPDFHRHDGGFVPAGHRVHVQQIRSCSRTQRHVLAVLGGFILHSARVAQHHETPVRVAVDGKEHEILFEDVDALGPLLHALVRFFLSHVRGLAPFVPDVRELLVEEGAEDVTPRRLVGFHLVLQILDEKLDHAVVEKLVVLQREQILRRHLDGADGRRRRARSVARGRVGENHLDVSYALRDGQLHRRARRASRVFRHVVVADDDSPGRPGAVRFLVVRENLDALGAARRFPGARPQRRRRIRRRGGRRPPLIVLLAFRDAAPRRERRARDLGGGTDSNAVEIRPLPTATALLPGIPGGLLKDVAGARSRPRSYLDHVAPSSPRRGVPPLRVFPKQAPRARRGVRARHGVRAQRGFVRVSSPITRGFPLVGFPLVALPSFLFLPVPFRQLLFLRGAGEVFVKVIINRVGFVVGTLLRARLLVELFFERLLQRNELLDNVDPKRQLVVNVGTGDLFEGVLGVGDGTLHPPQVVPHDVIEVAVTVTQGFILEHFVADLQEVSLPLRTLEPIEVRGSSGDQPHPACCTSSRARRLAGFFW